MKKSLLFTILFQIIFLAAFSSPVVINGKWERSGEEVSLYYIVSGRLEVLSTYILQDDRTFGFSFTPKSPGFYVIGSGYPQSKVDKYVFYFKPGDTFQVEFNEESYALVGENTVQNKALSDWHDKIAPLENMSVYFMKKNETYVDFFPLLEEFIHEEYVPLPTGDKHFDRLFDNFRRIDLISTALHFLSTPRSAHPVNEDYPNYYYQLNIEDITKDASLLEYPFGSSLLSNLLYTKNGLSDRNKPLPFHEELALIQNDTLKAEYLLKYAQRAKTYLGYTELVNPYRQYILTPDHQKRASDIVSKLAKESKSGEPAINFTHKDINGKDVSLSDFKGKVVVVDAWATWCGPCKKEMKDLQKLEKEFEGKDVVFMCVSVDDAKDQQKWKDFVKSEKLGGVQLFSGGFESEIVNFYDIKSIPRFMLFDKLGNIVSKDAPRPSSTELRLLLENELKK